MDLCMNCWLIYNLSNDLTACVFSLPDFVAMFPDLTNCFGEYNVIITKKNNGQSYKYRIQVVINKCHADVELSECGGVHLNGRLRSLLLSSVLLRMLRADRTEALLVLSQLPVGSIRVD